MVRTQTRWPAAWMAALGAAAISTGAVAAPACPNVGFTIVEAAASPQTRPVKGRPGQTVFVRADALTATADITEIALAGDDEETQLLLKFKPDAAKRLHDATTNHAGLRVALVADDQVKMAFTWTGPYGMDADLGTQLSIPNGMGWARPLVEAVRKCGVGGGG